MARMVGVRLRSTVRTARPKDAGRHRRGDPHVVLIVGCRNPELSEAEREAVAALVAGKPLGSIWKMANRDNWRLCRRVAGCQAACQAER